MPTTSDLTGCRILVLGAGPLREAAFASWARLGCETVLVDGAAWGHYENLVDRYLPWEVRDEHHPDIARLARLASTCDVVLTLLDESQLTVSQVARAAGLSGSGGCAASFARDKARQRLEARYHGLPHVPSVELREADDAVAAVEPVVPSPWIVKPIDAAGSAGVCMVTDPAGLSAACAAALATSHGGTCIVEGYVPGPEWSVELLVVRGEIIRRFFTLKDTVSEGCFVERRHTVGPLPQPSIQAAIDEVARDMVAMYRVETAACHLEVRIRDGSPVPIEMAVRPAGDGIVDLVRHAFGYDLYADLVRVLAGGSPAPVGPESRYASIEFLLAGGTVSGIPLPVDVHGDLKTVSHLVPLAPPGTRLTDLEANWSRAGYVVARGTDPALVITELAKATAAMAAAMGLRQF